MNFTSLKFPDSDASIALAISDQDSSLSWLDGVVNFSGKPMHGGIGGPWCADISGALFGALIYDAVIFTGGESPVNYPPRRRKRASRVRSVNLRKKLGIGRKKTRNLEKSLEEGM